LVSPLPRPVCLVQPTLFPEASRVDIYEYSCALARLGVETHVVVSENRSPALAGLTVHETRFAPRNTPMRWWRFAAFARAAVRRLVRERDLGLVHLFNPSPATWLLGWMLKREPQRPRIVYDLRTGGLGHRADALLVNAMARTAPRFADELIALTAALGTSLLGAGRFREVPLGVNLERFRPREGGARAQGEYTFIYAGTLSRNRELSSMLAAFAGVARDHPQARLVIAGDGDDRGRLEGFVAAHGLQHAVSFLGKRPHAEVPALLAAADCGLAYVPDEAWFAPQPQLKTLEYFAAGLPAVAVRTAGNRQVWGGLPAELLTADDAKSFAAGMRFALARRYENGLFRRAAEAHSWDRITRERLLPVYEATLASRKP
jgi:glycosyltransferase involved in cell wall biosynthesis